jgi:hypothetical protein
MNQTCETCGGDCCKYMILDYNRPDMSIPLFRDTLNWIERHHETYIESQDLTKRTAKIRFNYPCDCLGPDGRCRDYDGRPMTCRKWTCKKLCAAAAKEYREQA